MRGSDTHRPFGWVLTSTIALSIWAAPARAEHAFVAVATKGEADLTTSALVSSTLESKLTELGWQVIAADEAARKGLTAASLAACPVREPSCVGKLAAHAGVDRLLLVTLEVGRDAQGEPRIVLTGRLVDPASGTRLGASQRFCERCSAAETLSATTADLVTGLVREAAGVGATVLVVRSRPQGARVLIDGTLIGTTDLRYGVYPGDHRVRLELEGYRPEELHESVARDEVKLLQVDLAPVGHPSDGRPLRVWKWAALGGGVAVVATGVTLILIDQPASEDGHWNPTYRNSLEAGVVTTAVGAALLGTGVFLWVKDRRHGETGVAIRPTARGVLVSGRF